MTIATSILAGKTAKQLRQIRHKMRMTLRRIAYRDLPRDNLAPHLPGPDRFNYWHRHNDKKQPSLRRLARDRQKADNVAAKQAGL